MAFFTCMEQELEYPNLLRVIFLTQIVCKIIHKCKGNTPLLSYVQS